MTERITIATAFQTPVVAAPWASHEVVTMDRQIPKAQASVAREPKFASHRDRDNPLGVPAMARRYLIKNCAMARIGTATERATPAAFAPLEMSGIATTVETARTA